MPGTMVSTVLKWYNPNEKFPETQVQSLLIRDENNNNKKIQNKTEPNKNRLGELTDLAEFAELRTDRTLTKIKPARLRSLSS